MKESAMTLSSLTLASTLYCNSIISLLVIKVRISTLVDSGSSNSFIHPDLAPWLNLCSSPSRETVVMASFLLVVATLVHCFVDLVVQDKKYPNFKFPILPNLCADIIVGRDFMKLHNLVEFL